MGIEIRSIVPDEVDAFRRALGYAFNFDPDEDHAGGLKDRLEYDRTVAAFDGGEMVGTGGAFSLQLTVPGGAEPVPTGGTTVISVRPTHRRRGLLRSMMDFHLADVAERQEPLAALWASDSGIYGRFGYGPASYRVELEIDKDHVVFVGDPPAGRVDLVPVADVLPALRTVYDPVAARRPGMFARSDRWWELAILNDPKPWRDGYSERRYAVYRGAAGEPEGYALYRTKEKWERGHGAGVARVVELVTATDAAARSLWRYLGGLDLVTELTYWNGRIDNDLPWLVANPRRIHSKLTDGLWVRLMDVPTALSARRYRVEGRLMIEVVDNTWPAAAGVYELDGGPDGAECKPSDAEPELRLDAMALGAMYLGGNDVATLARTGHVEADPEAAHRADLMFGWHEAPWCQEVF